ncbi:MAG: ribosome-associated translation inhibitor RaiA [Peptoniphilaceae bacterium]|nr:ribosome-associated translation inhibitor RaiA [Peptoniphilaceae bacterium]
MKVTFYGKNINLRENTKLDVQKKLSRLDKYFSQDVEAKVTLSQEGTSMRAEITIPIPGSGTILRADQHDENLLDAVDACVAGLVSQIRKYKTKLEKKRYASESIRFSAIEDVPKEEVAQDEHDIARVKELEVMPMSPEEAIDQMELLGHDFFLFLNMETESICCVYRRKAGNYGMLVPKR